MKNCSGFDCNLTAALSYTRCVKTGDKKYILAVSGGVDSVVMLDMARQQHAPQQLIVAHFDHGIRADSALDARFVAGLAEKYGCAFRVRRAELGAGASEDRARRARYDFLFSLAREYGAEIWLAQHREDVVESVAINLARGTGWRGLAVMSREGLNRPIIAMTKREIYAYACQNRLEWVEDETNEKDYYLRNRLRRKIFESISGEARAKIAQLRDEQVRLKRAIFAEGASLLPDSRQARYFLAQLSPLVAEELLRIAIEQQTGVLVTRPQAARALLAVKTLSVGARCDVAEGIYLLMTQKGFEIRRAG